jgi:hypothetical protein
LEASGLVSDDMHVEKRRKSKKRSSEKKKSKSNRSKAEGVIDGENYFAPKRAQSPSGRAAQESAAQSSSRAGATSMRNSGGGTVTRRSNDSYNYSNGANSAEDAPAAPTAAAAVLRSSREPAAAEKDVASRPVGRREPPSGWQAAMMGITSEDSRVDSREFPVRSLRAPVESTQVSEIPSERRPIRSSNDDDEENEAISRAFDGLRVAPRRNNKSSAEVRNSLDSVSTSASSSLRKSGDGVVVSGAYATSGVVIGTAVSQGAPLTAPVIITRSGPPRKADKGGGKLSNTVAQSHESSRSENVLSSGVNDDSVVKSRESNRADTNARELEDSSEKDISEIDKRIKALQSFLDKAR